MKKILGLGLVLGSVATLSACNGIPECNEELDECSRGGAYTEERTAQADKKMVVEPPPAPAPAPEPVVIETPPPPAPEPVPEPAPEPVIDDTPVMTDAEPQFKQISK